MTKIQMSQTKSFKEVYHSRENGNPGGKDIYLDSCLRRNDPRGKLCFEFRYSNFGFKWNPKDA